MLVVLSQPALSPPPVFPFPFRSILDRIHIDGRGGHVRVSRIVFRAVDPITIGISLSSTKFSKFRPLSGVNDLWSRERERERVLEDDCDSQAVSFSDFERSREFLFVGVSIVS